MSDKENKGFLAKAFGAKAIKDVFGYTKTLIKESKPSKEKYYKETFDEAMKRHGVTEEKENSHLVSVYGKIKIQFLIMMLGSVLFFYFGISSIFSTQYMASVSYVLIAFALITLATQYGLRCFQIRKKHLGMLDVYLKTPSQWYPKKVSEEYLSKVEKEK